MAAEMLIINPKRRARRAPAKRRARARRRNPARSMPAVRRAVMRSNPRRRRHTYHARRRNPIRRRRNLSALGRGFSGAAISMVKTAALGAVGSAGVNAIMSFVQPQLPVSMATGTSYSAVKALATIFLGIFGRKAMGPMATEMATGALTVQAALLLNAQLGATFPTDGALGYYTSAMPVRGNGGGNRLVNQLNGRRGLGGGRGGVGMYVTPRGGMSGTVNEMAGHVWR